MNVRVQPTVRATYVSQENVLRFILKEMIPEEGTEAGAGADTFKQEVAIYVVKVSSYASMNIMTLADGGFTVLL